MVVLDRNNTATAMCTLGVYDSFALATISTKHEAKATIVQPENQDLVPQFGAPFLDGWSYEEWYGIVTQGNGDDSPFIRQLRPAYNTMKEMWNP